MLQLRLPSADHRVHMPWSGNFDDRARYLCTPWSSNNSPTLDIGSTYVRKLYYLGRKLRNIANVKIWFGAKE